jgi:hypothetical protein
MYYIEVKEKLVEQNFCYWKTIHDKSSLELFNTDAEGQLWLKIKSIIRPELIKEFVSKNNIILSASIATKQFEELYNILSKSIEKSHMILDEYIVEKNKQILSNLNTEKLVSELYKLKNFEWGGDYKNSLDKYLVSHYVKTISDYDELISKFDTEINHAVKGYVLNSWYNHWSSILIEHIFKLHKNVLPTVGQIKNVDFFINNIPFDLKVTYFPSEYLKIKRKENGYPVELTYLKSKAKELGISYDKNGSDIYYEITEKMKDKGTTACTNVLNTVKAQNMEIIKEAQNNSKLLSKWLYENQGEMRFGSENRLFLVLIDTEDFSNSWKLKRNTGLLTPVINDFLDNFIKKNINDLKIVFDYSGKPGPFNSLADVVFVIK